ncbi:MAG: Fur family transcriptional regulator [Myxococcota bacterium]
MTETARLKERFKEFLNHEGLKFTRQRRVISEVFFREGEGHRSLNELLSEAQQEFAAIGYATVYRTMKLMTDSGVALEHKFADTGLTLYEPNLEGDHHDHIICLTCGRIVEFEDERIEERQEAVAKAHGFEVRKHRHEIYGDCVKVDCEYRNVG